MKKRYLLILVAVIAAALLLVLPGTALATTGWSEDFNSYVSGSQIIGQGGWTNTPWFGSDVTVNSTFPNRGGNSVELTAAGTGMPGVYPPGDGAFHPLPDATTGTWVLTAWVYIPEDTALSGPGYSYVISMPYGMVAFNDGVAWTTTDGLGALPVTADQWVSIRWMIDLDDQTQQIYYGENLLYQGDYFLTPSNQGLVLHALGDDGPAVIHRVYVDDISFVPYADPPTMLNDLKDFIATAASIDIDPVIAPSLTTKLDSVLAALARGNKNYAKVAMNNLKALVNQVEAQTDKKISPEAAAQIIAQANAIVTALGY